eukprot:2007589-Amphidinium_carterae.2
MAQFVHLSVHTPNHEFVIVASSFVSTLSCNLALLDKKVQAGHPLEQSRLEDMRGETSSNNCALQSSRSCCSGPEEFHISPGMPVL